MSRSETELIRPIRSITLHFADDGTRIGSAPSQLFAAFDRVGRRSVWRSMIVRAFRAWGSILGIRVRLSSNTKDPFGATHPSPNFANVNVQIGARALDPSVSGLSFGAHDLLAGNWAGAMIFNSKANYRNPRDIYSVALHEVGHVLGLPHSPRVESIMNPNGNASRIVAPLDRKTLIDLTREFRVRNRDVSSVNQVRGQWALSRRWWNLSPIRSTFGVTLQRRFEVNPWLSKVYLRVPGITAKLDETNLTITLEQLGHSSAGNSKLRVFDENGKAIEFVTVNRQADIMTIQVEDADPRNSYFVELAPQATRGKSRFLLTADYGSSEVELNSVFSGRLQNDADHDFHVMRVSSSRILNLGLVAEGDSKEQPVYMVMRNRRGNVVETFSVSANEINDARTVWVNRGVYSLEVLTSGGNSEETKVKYDILADDPTKPGGPGLVDPTLRPLGQSPQVPGFGLTLHDKPIVLNASVADSRIWHTASNQQVIRWLGNGGQSGLGSSF